MNSQMTIGCIMSKVSSVKCEEEWGLFCSRRAPYTADDSAWHTVTGPYILRVVGQVVHHPVLEVLSTLVSSSLSLTFLGWMVWKAMEKSKNTVLPVLPRFRPIVCPLQPESLIVGSLRWFLWLSKVHWLLFCCSCSSSCTSVPTLIPRAPFMPFWIQQDRL